MSPAKKDPTQLVIGGEPRIDFLPIEVKQRKENRRSRRSLIMLVLVVLVACIGGYVFSAAMAVQSAAAVDAERARTAQLLAQQTEYAEARTIATETSSAKAAALVGSAREILWKNYFSELKAVLPEKTTIIQFAATSQDALLDESEVEMAPLQKARVAEILFTVTTPSLSSIDKMNVSLRDLPGFADASTVLLSKDEDATEYTVNVILHVNSTVLERRLFENKEPVDPDAAETDPAATTDGTTGAEG